MKTYKPKSDVSKYYSILFALPTTRILSLIALSLNLVLIFYGFYLYITYFVLILVVLTIYAYSTSSVFRRWKRILGLALIVEVVSFTIGLIKPVIGIIYSTIFIILSIQGIDGTRYYRYFICVLPAVLVLILFGYDTKYLLLVFIPVILDYLIYLIMGTYTIDGYKMPDIGSMYLRNYLSRSREIEIVFRKLPIEEYVKPVIILVDNDLALVYTDVHYGPFSNVGSSMLPRMLIDKLRRRGYRNVVVLHGMGSHDRNIPTYNDAIRYVNNILEIPNRSRGYELKCYECFRVKGGDHWDLLIIVFDKLSLILISRDKGIDDLPYSLQLLIDKYVRERGVGDVLLIDCHNHELNDEPDIDSLKNLLLRALDLIEESLKNSKAMKVKIRATTVKTSSPGIIGDEITLLELSMSNKRIILVYIPGNNMEPNLRAKIKEYISNNVGIPIDNVEVLTNDEHTETGTTSRSAYIPVTYSNELFKALDKGLKKLQSKPYIDNLRLFKDIVKIPLMNEGINLLKELLHKGFRLSAILILSYIIITPIILYILYILMNW